MALSLLELFRAAPTKCTLLSAGPIALAVAQLANALLNGLSLAVAAGFAAAMVAFAVVATGHCAAEHRIQRLERDLDVPPAGEFAD